MLINDDVTWVSNWSYGIKVVIENAGKTDIRVSSDWLKGGKRVLGGDVLAVPQRAPHPELAIKLIGRLVGMKPQRTLAETLYWAPVRDDVYQEIYAQQGTKEKYFKAIRYALSIAEMRPITPSWNLFQDVLSDALQDVLHQGREANGKLTTDEAMKAVKKLLGRYAERLKKIPLTYKACKVVQKQTAGPKDSETCEVEVPTKKSFKELADAFGTDADILAKANGRSELGPVSEKNMQFLLVPKEFKPWNLE